MGSSFCSQVFPDCSKEELKRKVSDEISTSAHESGHQYSGQWGSKPDGLHFLTQKFENINAAIEYMDDNNDKWDVLDAVRVQTFVELNADNKGTKVAALEEKIKTLRGKVQGFMPAIVKRTIEAKSALKSCDHCGSKVNIKLYLEKQRPYNYHGECPICRNNMLLTNTDKAAQAKLESMLKVSEEQLAVALKERSRALTKTETYVWVVGGNCPS